MIVSIFGVSGTGCTFVDWSINWLTGQTHHYSYDAQQWLPITSNPLGEFNAHGHPKNHPEGFEQVRSMVNSFNQAFSKHNTLATMYVSSSPELNDPQLIQQESNAIWTELAKQTRLVYVSCDSMFKVRNLITRSVNVDADEQVRIKKSQQAYLKFYPHSNFDQLPIEEQREIMALDIRPFQRIKLLDTLDLTVPHSTVNCIDLFENGELVMQEIIAELGLSINPDRFNAWIPVYRQWQEIHKPGIHWSLSLPHIVESIVNNWYYPIDLSFEQEAVVLHCLIYQHNLNLKCFGLTKFPNNTQLLHNLLEVNQHSLNYN